MTGFARLSALSSRFFLTSHVSRLTSLEQTMHIISPDGASPPGFVESGPVWPPGMVSAADRERFARYAEARAFYDGAQWLGRRRRGEIRLTVNYARALVRKIASYVFSAPVTFSVPA